MPLLVGDGAGERAALVAEQLALEEASGSAAQLIGDEGVVRAGRWRWMARASQLLAGPAFAGDEDGRVSSRPTFSMRR